MEYSLFGLAKHWLGEDELGNFSEEVDEAFRLIWNEAFATGYDSAVTFWRSTTSEREQCRVPTVQDEASKEKVLSKVEELAGDFAHDLCGELQVSQKEAYTLAYYALVDFAKEILKLWGRRGSLGCIVGS